jgi:hypothetical protein
MVLHKWRATYRAFPSGKVEIVAGAGEFAAASVGVRRLAA